VITKLIFANLAIRKNV